MKSISILGSTGSIGTQCADVAIKTECLVDYICFGKNIKVAEEQIRKLSPKFCCCSDENCASLLKAAVSDTACKVYSGRKSAVALISECDSDIIYNAVSGKNGLDFTLDAIKTGKRIGLANKESMVIAGDIVNAEAKKFSSEIIPVDSEHSAIFQCIQAASAKPKKILLTASGGPFFGMKKEEIASKTAKEALKHPNWNMGKKILIDSATLANKGLELIEAMMLFKVTSEQVKIIVQRQSIIHSMVQFSDNAVLAQLGVPDMRLCIEYALTYPFRENAVCNELDWDKIDNISISLPDTDTFPMLKLARKCAETLKSAPTVYNAADEIAVAYYLKDEIGFYDIFDICAECVEKLSLMPHNSIEDIEECDAKTREYARSILHKYIRT